MPNDHRMTDAELKLVANLAAAEKLATSGEWCVHEGRKYPHIKTSDGRFVHEFNYGPQSEHDAAFIALARNPARPLLDIIARQSQQIEHLRAEVARLGGGEFQEHVDGKKSSRELLRAARRE